MFQNKIEIYDTPLGLKRICEESDTQTVFEPSRSVKNIVVPLIKNVCIGDINWHVRCGLFKVWAILFDQFFAGRSRFGWGLTLLSCCECCCVLLSLEDGGTFDDSNIGCKMRRRALMNLNLIAEHVEGNISVGFAEARRRIAPSLTARTRRR